jgi:hypothetical protein
MRLPELVQGLIGGACLRLREALQAHFIADQVLIYQPFSRGAACRGATVQGSLIQEIRHLQLFDDFAFGDHIFARSDCYAVKHCS